SSAGKGECRRSTTPRPTCRGLPALDIRPPGVRPSGVLGRNGPAGGLQSTGLLLGRVDLIDAVRRAMGSVLEICQGLKVGKEELVGLLAATACYLKVGDIRCGQGGTPRRCPAIWSHGRGGRPTWGCEANRPLSFHCGGRSTLRLLGVPGIARRWADCR